ncbi:hypothetical protein BpHYR1_031890 [Brachionus plicatilis]|uniref:Uncharacterized protein n=1 Tax=Brachionus plicatilis TaxID=10195 RepID=A0A3M7SUE9_BRAPC|nr:hypothetical protein BpHYR1_031890 [Brachionus plicatilis]
MGSRVFRRLVFFEFNAGEPLPMFNGIFRTNLAVLWHTWVKIWPVHQSNLKIWSPFMTIMLEKVQSSAFRKGSLFLVDNLGINLRRLIEMIISSDSWYLECYIK